MNLSDRGLLMRYVTQPKMKLVCYSTKLYLQKNTCNCPSKFDGNLFNVLNSKFKLFGCFPSIFRVFINLLASPDRSLVKKSKIQ